MLLCQDQTLMSLCRSYTPDFDQYTLMPHSASSAQSLLGSVVVFESREYTRFLRTTRAVTGKQC